MIFINKVVHRSVKREESKNLRIGAILLILRQRVEKLNATIPEQLGALNRKGIIIKQRSQKKNDTASDPYSQLQTVNKSLMSIHTFTRNFVNCHTIWWLPDMSEINCSTSTGLPDIPNNMNSIQGIFLPIVQAIAVMSPS